MHQPRGYSRPFVLSGLLLLILTLGNCGKDPVKNDPTSTLGSITVNMVATEAIEADGHPVRATLLSELGDTVAIASATSQFDLTFAQVTLDEIPVGTYQLIVAMRHDTSAFAGQIQLDDSDYFWVGLEIMVTGADTITLSQDHWQLFSSKAILAVVRGIPEAYEGELVGGALFEDSTDVLASSQPWHTALASSYAFNGSVVLSLYVTSFFGIDELAAGNYDLWCVIDQNGTADDWQQGSNNARCEDGDMVAQVDIEYLGINADQLYEREADFALLNAQTLTLNMAIPDGVGLEGHVAYAYIFTDFNEPYVALGQTVVETAQATIGVDVLQAGIYRILLVVDKDNSYSEDWPDQLCLSPDDYVWGTLDLVVNTDLTIAISDSAWQHYESFLYTVKEIPAGNDGKVIAVGLYEDGRHPLNMNDAPVLGGAALIYNNSALVALHETGIYPHDPDGAIPVGDYDAWVLIDNDGDLADYATDSVYHPATIGDLYFSFSISYDEETRYGDYQERVGSFSPIVSISGDIDCPGFSGNNIYVYFFRENPFTAENASPVVTYMSPEPGWYEMPYYSNDSLYIVGFWDLDGSGEDGGPTPGDMVGAYGTASGDDLATDLDRVSTTTLATSNRNFELWYAWPAPSMKFGK